MLLSCELGDGNRRLGDVSGQSAGRRGSRTVADLERRRRGNSGAADRAARSVSSVGRRDLECCRSAAGRRGSAGDWVTDAARTSDLQAEGLRRLDFGSAAVAMQRRRTRRGCGGMERTRGSPAERRWAASEIGRRERTRFTKTCAGGEGASDFPSNFRKDNNMKE